jgi:Domain of unknown function (DUF4440)/Domain of unknown function (DUF3471)
LKQPSAKSKTKTLVLLSAATAFLLAASLGTTGSGTAITQQELVSRTQELFDAVAPGDQRPWKTYFAEDAMYLDETGHNMDKAALVKSIAPLPTGYSGTIKIVNPQSRIVGDTAILSYDMDETETVFGQQLSARYHATDTWMRRGGNWQVVAGQVLRYYEDPAPGQAETRAFPQYVGKYQLAPGVIMTVTAEGGQLYAQRGDRPKELLIPEAAGIFFRKGVEGRRLFHYGNNGKVDTLIDRRNNEDLVWKKMD